MRPPTRGNPSLAKSTTAGEKSSLPLNQGLTVCCSDDATSVKCWGMSERIWLERTSCANISWVDGPCKNGTSAKTTMAAAATGAAILTHDQTSLREIDRARPASARERRTGVGKC